VARCLPAAIASLAALWSGTAFAESDTPLFDFARDLPFLSVVSDRSAQLAAARYEIEHNPPPSEDCSRRLGANRFAEMYETLGSLQASMGDTAGAFDSLTKSLECNPRMAGVHSSLAFRLIDLRRFDEARAEAERARAIDAEDATADRVLTHLDFIEERWPDAIARLRGLIAGAPSPERATYSEILLWIAQRRSGVMHPEDSTAELTDEWPRPVLEFLRGALTEEDVLDAVEGEGGEFRLREKLCEALYYVGQHRLANGDLETARLYFGATVNLKVMYFIEHRLALAELEKMRARSP
jgi:tetratricopeptide (TPR) repeat protein